MTDYALRRLLTALVSKGAPDLSAVVSIAPAPAARQTQPTATEMATLRACPDMALRFVILACGEAGLRSGTVLKVTPAHAADGVISIRTKKGAAARTPISARLQATLDTIPRDAPQDTPCVELLAGRHWKFPSREIQKRWARWKKKCNVRADLRLHDLRRGLARRLYKVTGDIRAVQQLLSHRSLAATIWYLDASNRTVTPDALQAAIAEDNAL